MQSKLPQIGTTIFSTMSKMALEHQAINLAQGFPNFPIDGKLQEILLQTSHENVHQYAPMPGNSNLIEELITLTKTSYKRTVTADEILVTAGATQAIFTAIQALVFPGEEVIILDPAYDCYAPSVELVGGVCKHLSLEEDFSVDWNKLDHLITDKTKLLIINNPHNPSGTILNAEDLKNLASIFEKHKNLFLLSDEVYEYITFEKKHISVNEIASLVDRSIIVSSFGKSFHITGWKIGYILAPKYILDEIKKIHQFLVFSVNSVSQQTLANYLKQVEVEKLGEFYQEKRDFFRNCMKESRFKLLPCEGSFFQAVDYSEISQENDLVFCESLVKKHGVAAIPLSVFYKDKTDRKIIRFCFAKTNETLTLAAEKLCQI